MRYKDFLKTKEFQDDLSGFKPIWIPDFLFDFQKELVEWAVRKGRCALFEDCGLGKTPQSLVWCENVVRKTNGKVLIVTPLAVSHQTIREAEKFGIQANRSQDGLSHNGITVTNYERLSRFDPKEFAGIVCDESSILKGFDGKTRKLITEFVQTIHYRLLCTATPAPNDFMELGTSAQALGNMTHNQMLGMFFTHCGDTTSQWVLKSHAKKKFWEWVSTWARAVRRPSDLGFDDGKFDLPNLRYRNHVVESPGKKGLLVASPAITLEEQRKERRETLQSRCEKVAEIISRNSACVCWCHLNDEGDMLENIIPDAVQVAGKDSDEEKERKLIGFVDGSIRVLITKPRIGGFGMNWQHCSHVTYFPSHSYEQFYQCIRRCWRFGQKRNVRCDIISSERESIVVKNMIRKERQADEMYNGIVRHMSEFQLGKKQVDNNQQKVKVPFWL